MMITKSQSLQSIYNQLLVSHKLNVTRGPWHNFSHNLAVNAIVLDIDDIKELSLLMQIVNGQNMILQNSGEPPICVRAAAGWRDNAQANTLGWEVSNNAWQHQQTHRYNESFSITPSASEGDIIVRFSKTFQNKYYRQEGTDVVVPAGMQIGELARRMDASPIPLSLPTVSMIFPVSAVGLAANDGHGTGRNQPGFARLIKKMDLIDDQGFLVEVTQTSMQRFKLDKDGNIMGSEPLKTIPYGSAILRAHMGMFGIVTKIVIEAEQSFNLKEHRYTSKTFEGLTRSVPLGEHFNKEYSTFMWMPGKEDTPRFEFRHWERTPEQSQIKHPAFTPDQFSREQEIQIQLNGVVGELVYERGFTQLIPLMQKIGAMLAIGKNVHNENNPDTRIGKELDITHYQVAFPNDLMDISMLFPVKDKDITALFHHLVTQTERLLKEHPFDQACPISYAVYARYLKGSSDKFSPLRTEADEHILAFEWVTHPQAPHLTLFLKQLFDIIRKNPYVQPRFHLGKFVPKNADFSTLLGQDAVNETKNALRDYYGSEERLATSPFLTPYLLSKLKGTSVQLLPSTQAEVEAALEPYRKHKVNSRRSDQDLMTKMFYCIQQLGCTLTPEERQVFQPAENPQRRANSCSIV